MIQGMKMQCYYAFYHDKNGTEIKRYFFGAENEKHARAIVDSEKPEEAVRGYYGMARLQHAQSIEFDKSLGDSTLRDMLNGLNQPEKENEEAEKEAKKPRVVA